MNVAARRRLGILAVVLAVAVAVYFVWQRQRVEPLPPGIFVGNGRLEGTEISIATKTAGRVKDVLVREGDFVE
jgi:HlyD family secretion protein